MSKPEYISVRVGDEFQDALIVKRNRLTVIVSLPDGNVIKRHLKKHVANYGKYIGSEIL